MDVEGVTATFKAWEHLTVAERREVLELLVDRIIVKTNEIILDLYDGRDGKRTLKSEPLGRR